MAVIKSGATSDNWTIDATSKAGRVGIYDTTGNPIGAELELDGHYSLHTSITQNVFASVKNSSTAQILAGATWTGLSESTLGVAGIQINTFLDKKHTITLYQSMDNSNWDISDIYTHPSNYGSARTFQATASYYKVSIKNEAATDTGQVRIQTALCPTVEAIPRALTSGGNLRVTACAEWQSTRLTTGIYACSTFRTPGRASAPQNLFTIFNPATSTVNLAVRGLSINSDSTGALASVTPMIKLSRATSISAGTVLAVSKFQTANATAQAELRGDSSADDTSSASTIVATAGTTLWTQNFDRLHTAVGWTTHSNYNMIPDVGTDLRQIILVPGEALLLQAPTTNILATTSFIVNCSWLEYSAV